MLELPKTHWIWTPDRTEQVNGKPALVRFRKTVRLESVPDTLPVRISADTRYKLYVNGVFVEFGPARGDSRVWYSDTVELASWLHPGDNTLAVVLYTYMTSGDDRLARQCMEAFRLSQRADGMINCCYPHWGPNVIPGFSIYYILMVYDHMMYFGDRKLVRRHLGTIDGILEYFDNHLEERGIVGKTGGHISERYWSFIGWAVPWGPTVGTPPSGLHGPITMESFLYVMGLQHAAKLCDYVGRTATAEEYRSCARSVQKAINACCRDEEGFYLDSPGVREYSQHCQVFALLTDTVSVEEGRPLLLATLEDPERFAQCTVASRFYVFRALEKAGAYDRTYPLWEAWRDMLRNHLSTCVENDTDARSDCHAWGSVLLYELPAVILGVQPAAPGYARVKIAPNPGYLDWAKGDVVTPYGMVHVEWKKEENGTMELHYTVPEEMKDKLEIRSCCQ